MKIKVSFLVPFLIKKFMILVIKGRSIFAESVFQIQSPICSVNFSLSLHDLIISHHVKHPPSICLKKFIPSCKAFFTKKVRPYFAGGEERLCFILISFPISKSFIPNSCDTDYIPFKQSYLATVFKVIQYGFEIFQTVLSRKWKPYI